MGQKGWNQAVVFGFLGLLTGFLVYGAVQPDLGFSQGENRYLQQKPVLSLETVLDGSFSRQYEVYLSDQFPAREGWVTAQTMVSRFLGQRDANGVYFGKHGYLMEKFEAEDLETPLMEENLDHMAGFVSRMGESLGRERVRVMLVPGASQILKEKLPSLAAPYKQSQISKKMIQKLEEYTMGLSAALVPVEQALRVRREEELYYKTDHHWTTTGAYYGYGAWANSLGMVPWNQDVFDKQQVSADFYGTLYSKVQMAKSPDSIVLYEPKESVDYWVEYDNNGIFQTELYTKKALSTRDQYAVFLDGNHGLVRMINDSPGGKEERVGKKLLLVKDSYANSMAPFLLNHFEEVLMVDLRYFNANLEAFARENRVTDLLVLYRIPGLAQEKTISKMR